MPRVVGRAVLGVSAILAGLVGASRATQDAVANGDTRTLNIFHTHSKEAAQITFRRDGRYDPQGLDQLNWILRDWRLDKSTKMDPRLFDIVWQVYREVGAREPIHVVSAYRAPETNAMLRRRSRAVSEHSQHMLGKAMDFHLPDVPVDRTRAIAMKLQQGGVGYYPHSYNPFVHLDVGSVRAWPRMSRDQLARLFPDGKTVHLPTDGVPLARYEEAKAEVLARGGTVSGVSAYADAGGYTGQRKSLWASLFGGDDEDADYYRSQTRGGLGTRGVAGAGSQVAAYAPTSSGEDAGTRGLFAGGTEQQASSARAGRGGRGTQVAALAQESPAAVQEPFNPLRFLTQDSPTVPAETATAPGGLTAALVPVPPRRPEDIPLVAGLSPVPLPPARPITLAAADAVPLPDRAGAVPALLVAPAPTMAAAPAPSARPEPAPAATTAAAGDRGALRALFVAAASAPAGAEPKRPVATARAKPQPITTASIAGSGGAVLNLGFSASASELSTSGFTGPAVKPLPVLR